MLRILTSGESHGLGLTAIIDGFPLGVVFDESFIKSKLEQRQKGFGRSKRMQIETDTVRCLSGVSNGFTTGNPITLFIENKDYKNSFHSTKEFSIPRPGHADYAASCKFQIENLRNISERASARMTAMTVAVGALCEIFLQNFDISILGSVTQIGPVPMDNKDANFFDFQRLQKSVSQSQVRCSSPSASKKMMLAIQEAKKRNDTLGGVFQVCSYHVIPGLGGFNQLENRLDGILGQAILSIPSVKGVLFGNILQTHAMYGSNAHDPIMFDSEKQDIYRQSNHAGGIEGGITNGENIIITGFVKPINTLPKGISSVDLKTSEQKKAPYFRSDVCAVPAISVIAEAQIAIELARLYLERFGSTNLVEIKKNFDGYKQWLSMRFQKKDTTDSDSII